MTINVFLTHSFDYNYNAQVAIARSSTSVSHGHATAFPPGGDRATFLTVPSP